MTDADQLIALVATVRDVPSEERETFAAAAATTARHERAFLMHTCHRADLYLYGPLAPEAQGPQLPEELPAGIRRLEGRAAAQHLLEMAAGLDSVVVGEDQVQQQLREQVSARHDGAGLHPVLHRLMETALRVGRAARSRRHGPPRSLGDVAIERLASELGALTDRRILIVGAGRMAALTAKAAHRHGARIIVANRHRERAAELANVYGGDAIALASDPPAVDAVVCAIGAEWAIGAETRRSLIDRQVPVVDLSSPPALDADLRAALGPRYASIDELGARADDAARARERRRLQRTIDEAEAGFFGWLQTRSSVPLIEAIRISAEQQRVEELERLFRRAELPDHERALVEQMSRRLVAGLIHQPLATLREDEEGELDRAARELFSL